MQFEKGHKKIGGRKKGTPNNVDMQIKRFIEKVVKYASRPKKFQQLCDKAKPDTILNFIAKVAPKSLNLSADIPINPIAEALRRIKDKEEDENTNSDSGSNA